jgi:hypothetical protein
VCHDAHSTCTCKKEGPLTLLGMQEQRGALGVMFHKRGAYLCNPKRKEATGEMEILSPRPPHHVHAGHTAAPLLICLQLTTGGHPPPPADCPFVLQPKY